MKKKVFVLLLFICPFLFDHMVMAQDIIVRTDGSIIRAVISEIDDNSILYHQWEAPSGPAYRIGLDKVNKIQFQNGTEQSFSKAKVQTDNDDIFSRKLDKSGRLEYIGKGDFKLNSRILFNDSQYEELFVPEGYYDTFKSAQVQRRMGNVFIPVGAGLIGLGTLYGAISIGLAVDSYKESWGTEIWTSDLTPFTIVSLSCIAVGGTLLSIGIPLKVIGTKRLKWIASDYNARHSTTASLSIGPTPDGLGLMLYF